MSEVGYAVHSAFLGWSQHVGSRLESSKRGDTSQNVPDEEMAFECLRALPRTDPVSGCTLFVAFFS